MKKLLLFLFLVPLISVAQISINNNHMPQNGDTLRYSVALLDTSVLFNYNATGANQVWRFDSLVAQRQGLYEYVASSQTPYGFFVPNRIGEKIADTIAIGPVQLINLYDFYQNNSSGFKTTHRGFTLGALPFPISQSFQDEDEVYQFPLNYQDRDSSNFRFTFSNPLAGAFLENKGYRINDVEAWGSITTPYGTFNCIKVVTDVVSTDTVSFSTTNFGIETHIREYKWLSTSTKIPVATLSGPVIASVFIPTTVEYRDSVRPVPSVFAPTALFNADSTEVAINQPLNFNNLTISLLPARYKWEITPSTFNYANGTNQNTDSIVVNFTDTGFYDVQLIARNSQGVDTLFRGSYIKVVAPNSIVNQEISKSKAYPNPVKQGSQLFIEGEDFSQMTSITMYDVSGKVHPIHHTFEQQKLVIHTNHPPGHYILQLLFNDQHKEIPLVIVK